jgi:fumarate reductase flavoprotein subunit
LVFGARAGRAAADFATDQKAPSRYLLAQAVDEERRIEQQFLRRTDGSESVATIREEMQRTMEESAGIYRTGASLLAAAEKLSTLQARFQRVAISDHSHTFNTELTAVLELSFMLDVAEAIVKCALHRTESRGAHQRTDFPTREDGRFLAHSLVYRQEDGSSRVEYLPVTITRWPPAERVYGK